jgi:uncharacterized Zn finger protein (UPF0148 family)
MAECKTCGGLHFVGETGAIPCPTCAASRRIAALEASLAQAETEPSETKETSMDIRELQRQVNLRWAKQVGNPCHRSADANHALIHMMKALGKVASALNDAAHEERDPVADEIGKYLADLVICAARLGFGISDLESEVLARLEEKFPVAVKPGAEGG